jgi:hypothetical protein
MAEVVEKLQCPDCGGPLKVAPGEAIATCPYCGSDVNLAVGSKYFLAHSILPNRIAAGEVEAAARSWMSGGFLKPDDLERKARIVTAELSVVPLYVMNADAKTTYTGFFTRGGPAAERSGTMAKEYFWKVLARRASRFPVREYQVPLGAKVPFALAHVPAGAAFLNAELDDGEAARLARQQIDANQRYLLRDDVDSFSSVETEVDIRDLELLHVPAWNVRYEYRKRIHELVIDGQTGQAISGEIPQGKGGLLGSAFG